MTSHIEPAVLADVLKRHCNINSLRKDWPDNIKRVLSRNPDRARLFKSELADAILNHTISPGDYERWTAEDFDTPEDLNKWLRELWQMVYGDEPISAEPQVT